jgi:hypothetical protein
MESLTKPILTTSNGTGSRREWERHRVRSFARQNLGHVRKDWYCEYSDNCRPRSRNGDRHVLNS